MLLPMVLVIPYKILDKYSIKYWSVPDQHEFLFGSSNQLALQYGRVQYWIEAKMGSELVVGSIHCQTWDKPSPSFCLLGIDLVIGLE